MLKATCESDYRLLLNISICWIRYSIVHLVGMFFSSNALARRTQIWTMLFEEEGVKKLENSCLCYSIIGKRHNTNYSSYVALEIIEMLPICLHIKYDEHDKVHFWTCIAKEFKRKSHEQKQSIQVW